ncbi:NACHT domain-containing protein [Streptomyces sp. NBC_01485]|uniref:NACHT domain-containing protein n=1 Tax=Streptomyces sp. NBC_01485 TaxID=2903884 RepID=UPI002E30868A|nr:NACHT domain-containing protein [Streptomyces sp. NBC_01485]
MQHVVGLCRLSGSGSTTGTKTHGSVLPPRDEFFVDIHVTKAGRTGQQPITHCLGASKPAVLTLVGGPGAGKTTLLKQLALKAAEGELKSPRSIPVLLQLRDHAHDIADTPWITLADVIHASVRESQGGSRVGWFQRRLDDGRCLVLLDGLDEVAFAEQHAVSLWIAEQVARHPANDFLITSRALPAPEWPSETAQRLTLQRFTDKQVAEYLEHWLRDNSGLVSRRAKENARLDTRKMLDALRARPDLFELARNPVMLRLLTTRYRFTGQLPSSRTAVYGEFVEFLLSRRQFRVAGSPEISPVRAQRVVRVLALALTEDGSEQASEAKCARMIERALLRSGSMDPERFLRLMVEDGILVRPGNGMYAFAHRAFQDYLAAVQIGAQGSVRLLVEHMEDPRWRDIILTWASSADASPFIEACLTRGTDEALDLALACAEVTPQIEPELRSLLPRLRRPQRTVGATTGTLTAFVEKEHSAPAAELLRRARDQHRPVGREDIAGLLTRAESRPAHEWSEADASAFLSAAVLATEAARHGEASGYRFKGLIALGYAMRGQSLASSRDLCLAALRDLDRKRPRMADVRLACLAYLGSTADPEVEAEVERALRASCREAGAKACGLMVPLVAAHKGAARLVVNALRADEELARQFADDLGTDPAGATTTTGWEPAIEKWHRARRDLVHQFCGLAQLALRKEVLLHARERVADCLKEQVTETLELEGLARALDRLDHFLRHRQFDERDAALRAAARYAGAVRAAVRGAPTDLSVELSEPAAARIETLVHDERRLLAKRHQPQPGIHEALPSARLVGRIVTVPVEVANEDERSAPIESAWLTATGDPALLIQGNGRTEVPAPVSGGAATTVLLRLELTETAQDATEIEVEVTLHYRPRDSEDDAVRQARLTVAVDRDHTPVEPNPFTAGDSGSPVDDPDMLYGRDELIDKILTRLRGASKPGAGIALFGQKRTGKSSIGVELMRRLRVVHGLPVVDVGNLGGLTPQQKRNTDQGTLLGTLLWRILEGADKTITTGPRLIPDGFDREALIESPDPVGDCTGLFDRYRTARPDSPPWVVFIDEFQYMDQWIRDELVHPSFMRTFKAIIERRLFHLVLVGQTHLERLVEDDPNAFGVFGLERVTCLAEPDARALMQQPVLLDTPGGRVSRYHDRALDEILRLTGGNPYYIQKICYGLVQHMNKEHASMATDADVRQVTAHLLDTLRRGHFDGLESPDAGDPRWTAPELRAALVAVTRACHDGPASREAIQRCHEGPLAPELLEHLVSREVVRQVGDRYQFVVGLYEEWLRRYFAAPEGRP